MNNFEVFQPKHFATSLTSMAKQLVPPEVFAERGVKSLELIDDRLLVFIDKLRHNLGVPLTVNNGTSYTQSGLRDVNHYGTYEKMAASYSQHKYGKALDFRSSKMSSREIRKHIIENRELYPEITFMEVGISWVHVDVRTRLEPVWCRFWHPKKGFVSMEDVLVENM